MPPALHPQAKFDPIPPGFDFRALVDNTPNLSWVPRISTSQIRNFSATEFERLILKHVVENGRPFVIEGWNKALLPDLFSAKWLEQHYNTKQETVRDLGRQADMCMTIGHYLRSMTQLTNQWTRDNFREERRQRLYLKDIDCFPEWHDFLVKVMPACLFYMNSNVEEKCHIIQQDMNDMKRSEQHNLPKRTIAIAGDLMSSLPTLMRAENLMCYIGHEGTYTPAHREMCASLGQNIMVEASGSDNGEKPGSSIWFMTESKDREVVREYFLSILGHDIEIENHFAQINAWKKANFPVYVVDQRPGDFILIPPMAVHQVWNRGTRTMKVAWNRTTAQTLQLALHESLPRSRLVCRDEQYKNKAIVFFTLHKYYQDLTSVNDSADNAWLEAGGHSLIESSPRVKEMACDFKSLFGLYTEILVDEMFAYKVKDVEYIEFDSNITCSYCRSNIFNRFLTCKRCVRELVNGEVDTYDVCMECYAMGRSCSCVSGLTWCEQFVWAELVDDYELWRNLVIKNDGYVDIDSSPPPLELAQRRRGKKSVAAICQEQLQRRSVVHFATDWLARPQASDQVSQKRKKKTAAMRTKRCHVCWRDEYIFKLQFCTNSECTEAYCYGVLYRAFDIIPQAAMEKKNWICPKCQGICNCANCRKSGTTTPYEPRNTLLGLDTLKVADDRSIDVLVDFRRHNLAWLKAAGEEGRNKYSKRMKRLKAQAQAEKAKSQSTLGDTLYRESNGSDLMLEQATEVQSLLGGDTPSIIDPVMAEDSMQQEQPASKVFQGSVCNGSAYPDPPSPESREQMLGVGYYQQDDSTDRILFDPYQPQMCQVQENPWRTETTMDSMHARKFKSQRQEDSSDTQSGQTPCKKLRIERPAEPFNYDVNSAPLDEIGAQRDNHSITPNSLNSQCLVDSQVNYVTPNLSVRCLRSTPTPLPCAAAVELPVIRPKLSAGSPSPLTTHVEPNTTTTASQSPAMPPTLPKPQSPLKSSNKVDCLTPNVKRNGAQSKKIRPRSAAAAMWSNKPITRRMTRSFYAEAGSLDEARLMEPLMPQAKGHKAQADRSSNDSRSSTPPGDDVLAKSTVRQLRRGGVCREDHEVSGQVSQEPAKTGRGPSHFPSRPPEPNVAQVARSRTASAGHQKQSNPKTANSHTMQTRNRRNPKRSTTDKT